MSQCDNASGLPWVPCDGITNPAAIASGDSPSQSNMVSAVSDAALAAFYSSNDTALANKHIDYGAKVLKAWFIDNSTRMLPNLCVCRHSSASHLQPQPSPRIDAALQQLLTAVHVSCAASTVKLARTRRRRPRGTGASSSGLTRPCSWIT